MFFISFEYFEKPDSGLGYKNGRKTNCNWPKLFRGCKKCKITFHLIPNSTFSDEEWAPFVSSGENKNKKAT